MTTIEKMEQALGQVTNYDSKEEYLQNDLLTDEDFNYHLENNEIQDITTGTYNGATQTMQYKELTLENQYDMLWREVCESMFIENDIGDLFDFEPEPWEIILAYTTSYPVFTVDGRMYVSML